MSVGGRSTVADPRGRFRQFVQVLAVGRNEDDASTNSNSGCRQKPKTGSSSAPVAKLKMCCRVILALLPPRTRHNYDILEMYVFYNSINQHLQQGLRKSKGQAGIEVFVEHCLQ